jgi:hypothetical protein
LLALLLALVCCCYTAAANTVTVMVGSMPRRCLVIPQSSAAMRLSDASGHLPQGHLLSRRSFELVWVSTSSPLISTAVTAVAANTQGTKATAPMGETF